MLAHQLYELHSALILRHRPSEITRFISSSDTQSENLWTDSANRRFEFNKRSQLFIRVYNEAFPVIRDARQQRRVFALRNSRLIRSPKLQPALLRLSAVISQYFICDDSDLVMIRAHLKDLGSTSVMNSKLEKLSLDHPAISPIPLPSLRLLNVLD